MIWSKIVAYFFYIWNPFPVNFFYVISFFAIIILFLFWKKNKFKK
jgi:hypothetical protein